MYNNAQRVMNTRVKGRFDVQCRQWHSHGKQLTDTLDFPSWEIHTE